MTEPTPRPAVPSPCIRVCQVSGTTGWCEGCFRTLSEIARWRRFSDAERDTVLADLPRRRAIQEEKDRTGAG